MALGHRLGLAALAATFLVAAGPATAQSRWSGFYGGLVGIGSFRSDMDDFSSNGVVNRTMHNDWDTVAGIGGVVGYAWRELPIRVELEVAHRFRFDLDLRGGAAGTIDYESNVETTSAVVNLLFEWRNQSSFTPFVGATLGYGHNKSETTRRDLVTGATDKDSGGEDNLIWGALVGVDWAFAERWSASAAYRYIDLGEVFSGNVAGESYRADSYTAHELLLSILYRF